MAGLVIGVWLSAPTCYSTEPEPPYNETGAKEFDPEDLPWSNETDVIILPPPPPLPITNETDIVIIVTDPLEELNLKIDRIDAELVSLQDNIAQAFNMIGDALVENIEGDRELVERIDVLSMDTEELRDELASTNRELKMIRNSMNNVTILFGAFSVLAIGIVAMTRRP